MRPQGSRLVFALIVMGGGALGACSRAVAPLVSPGASAVALTGGPNTSMVYVARTSEGVVAIDLGWWGHERALNRAMSELGSAIADVNVVFLTHSHFDHLGAWPVVLHAVFHVAEAEYSYLVGDSSHGGWITRLGYRLKRRTLPRASELDVRTFSQDTTFIIGTDTLRAYLVAGHTAGSTVYLFRGVLFLGDAATYSIWRGFAPARRGYSADARLGAENLERLWTRLPPGVRYVCTAHAHCTSFSENFLRDIAR